MDRQGELDLHDDGQDHRTPVGPVPYELAERAPACLLDGLPVGHLLALELLEGVEDPVRRSSGNRASGPM